MSSSFDSSLRSISNQRRPSNSNVWYEYVPGYWVYDYWAWGAFEIRDESS